MMYLRRFLSYKQNWLGLAIVGLFVIMAIAAPWLSPPVEPDLERGVSADDAIDMRPYKEIKSGYNQLPEPPRPGSPLGSVPKPPFQAPGVPAGQGRSYQWDIFHTLIWGSRSALRFGIIVTLVTATIGVVLGALSAYAGGPLGGLIMRTTDAFLAFPFIAAIWLLERVVFSSTRGAFVTQAEIAPWQQMLLDLRIDSLLVVFIFFGWMPYARIINTTIANLMESEFIMAARSIGASNRRILLRHLLPNAISPAIVLAARDVGAVVVLATAFMFIGLSGGGYLSWGIVLVGGRDYIIGLGGNPFIYWWVFLPIALALILFGFGWNLLGDGLNTALNPRSVSGRVGNSGGNLSADKNQTVGPAPG